MNVPLDPSTYHSRKYFLEPLCCSQGLGLATHQTIFKLIQRLPHRVGVGDLGIVHKCDMSDAPALHGDGRLWHAPDKYMFLQVSRKGFAF